jgi:two-component system, cell cycle sensor histidine kinase and response regulator CckA
VITSGKPRILYEERQTREDGNDSWLQTSKVPMRDSRGKIIGVLGTYQDITEQKKMEAHFQQAQKMEAIGTLSGGIAHDFNNILSAIIGYSELSLSKIESESPIHGHLNKVIKAGERARDLVQQILTFGRQHEGELSPVRIKLIVKEVAKFIRAALPTTIEINQHIHDDPTVMADPTQIHQIIMNLCTNAGHAMQENGGILEIGIESIDPDSEFMGSHFGLQPGSYIKLTISDTGDGIPPENINRIFEPYFTTKEQGKGTGLGLAIVHGIVKSYGGIITVDSWAGKGTTFDIYLPSNEDSNKTKEDTESKPIGGKERILLVDDEHDIIEIEKGILEQLGYVVTPTVKADKALEIFAERADQFDLVISDLTMPKITGDKLALELIKIRPDIPIILCTGFSEKMTEEKAASLGVKGFLMKPVTVNSLTHVVRNVLDEK